MPCLYGQCGPCMSVYILMINREGQGVIHDILRLGLGTRLGPAATILAVTSDLLASCHRRGSLPFTSAIDCLDVTRCPCLSGHLLHSLPLLQDATRPLHRQQSLSHWHFSWSDPTSLALVSSSLSSFCTGSGRPAAVGRRLRRIRARRLLPRLLAVAVGDVFSQSGEARHRGGGEGSVVWGNPEVERSGIALAGSLVAAAKYHSDC